MNDVYVFIATHNGLISYPNDQTHSYFQYAISKAKNNAQIVLVRKDSLSHYCYVRKIADKQYFGICLRLDCIYKDTEDLFRAFDAAYANLIQDGVLLQMTDDANVIIHETNLSDESVAIAELTDNLLHALAISGKTTLPLPPADFSISIKDCIELSFEDSTNVEIIRAIQKYSNVYIVKTHDEISRITECKKLIQKLKDEINQLQDIVFKQKNEISDLKKQKNKYKWVLFLLAIIFIGAIVFFNVMQSKNDSIYELQQENVNLAQHVGTLQGDSIQLERNLKSVTNEKNRIELALQDSIEALGIVRDSLHKQEALLSKYPLLIQNIQIANVYDGGTIETNYGGTIYSKNSMRLKPKISYVGLVPGTKELGIKWYYPSGNLATCSNCNCPSAYTQCEEHEIQAGMHSLTTNAFGGKEKGHWNTGQHRIEIWCEGNKLAERTFTIH